MDFRLRRHVDKVKGSCSGADRLTNLPDEILSSILSLLVTKDAAVASAVSKKMTHAFRRVTNLDFDDAPISHCSERPHLREHFEIFKMFVNSVLGAFQSPCLNRFRLHFGGQGCIDRAGYRANIMSECSEACHPEIEPTANLNTWISFPFTRSGVREINLRIHVRQPPQLPPALLTCDTLEVLKLDINLEFVQVSAMSSYSLPCLKVLHLRSALFPDDGFLTRLVSSCPSLEDLSVRECWWEHGNILSISSPSLRTLDLDILRIDDLKHGDYVLFDTPNLQYIDFVDNLASRYCITPMSTLVRAEIGTFHCLRGSYQETTFQSMLSLVRPLSSARHISLWEACMEALDFGDLKDKLPVFHNLKYLELGATLDQWGPVLLELLNCSPFLETLDFPRGLMQSCNDKAQVSERELCNTTQVISCSTHLKRILIGRCQGTERELDLLKFLLRSTLVLEKLVICQSQSEQDPKLLESKLKNLPRASMNCSVEVR